MFISKTTIDAVRERAQIEEIVAESVQLKRAGRNLVGLCPFHAEGSPSFNVSPERNHYRCFGCSANGDPISFIMELKGLSFAEAIRELAQRYNIPIELTSGGGSDKGSTGSLSAQRAYKINQAAAEFFSQSLKSAPAQVHEYLEKRGLDSKAIAMFGIGYAPMNAAGFGDALSRYLQRKGLEAQSLLDVGLSRRSERGELYDLFRGRIIFPVWGDSSKIVAFGGRSVPGLSDERAPKYINSPETVVYQKQRVLYGLPYALEAIRHEQRIFIVEGYLDVIGLMMAGVRPVVATCGTALTERHIERLARLAPRITVLFDGDSAGRAAAAKSFDLFVNTKAKVEVMFLPDQLDPDDFARRHGDKTALELESLPTREPLDCFIAGEIERLLPSVGGVSSSDGTLDPKLLGPGLLGSIGSEVAKRLAKVKNGIERGELAERAAMQLRINVKQLSELVDANLRGTSSNQGESLSAPQRAPQASDSTVGHPERGSTPPVPGAAVAYDTLSKLDREVVLLGMAGRARFCERILRTPEFVSSLSAAALQFIDELMRVLTGPFSADPERQKGAVKQLLSRYGPAWVSAWRQAHALTTDKEIDLEQALSDCAQTIKIHRLDEDIARIKGEIADTSEAALKQELSQTVVALIRAKDAVRAGVGQNPSPV